MSFWEILMYVFMTTVVGNTIFDRAIGTTTLFNSVKKEGQAVYFGLTVTYFTTVSSALTYFADHFLGDGWLGTSKNYYIYQPIIYVLIVGLVYALSLIVLWRISKSFFGKIKKYIHLSVFNCAVFGALFINSLESKTFLEYLLFGFLIGIGFFLAVGVMAASREKLNSEDIPESFQGFPISMIYVGVISMTLYCLK